MWARLVVASVCAVTALAAPVPGDLSGYWEMNGQCSESGLFPFQFVAARHCGSTVILAPVECVAFAVFSEPFLVVHMLPMLLSTVVSTRCKAITLWARTRTAF
jgi:hypothetical protein